MRWGRVADRLLYYGKTQRGNWNQQYLLYEESYIKKRYRYHDGKTGRLFWPNTMTAAGAGPARIFQGTLMEPPAGTHWRYSQEQIDRMDDQSTRRSGWAVFRAAEANSAFVQQVFVRVWWRQERRVLPAGDYGGVVHLTAEVAPSP